MSDYYRDSLRIKEEELRIANDLVEFKNECLQRLNKKLERLEEENKKLKEENGLLTLQLKETREFFVDVKMENVELEKESKALRLQADIYFEKWQEELMRLGGRVDGV